MNIKQTAYILFIFFSLTTGSVFSQETDSINNNSDCGSCHIQYPYSSQTQHNSNLKKPTEGFQPLNLAGSGSYGGRIYSLDISASDPDIMYASVNTGLYKSVNAGQNWTSVFDYYTFNKIVIDDRSPDIVYAFRPC